MGTASIAGVVTLNGSPTPVRRAQVSLNGGGMRGGRSTITNDQGRFSFVGLPAGRFTLNVSKPGYVTIAYGAKKPGRQGTPIQLVDGQVMNNVNIGLPKGGVITGVVVDEAGEPAPNTTVRSFRYTLQNGQKTLQTTQTAQTDDRGIYRLFQLQPGDYIVSAVPRNVAVTDVTLQLQAQLQPLLDQVQAAGGIGALAKGAGAPSAVGGLIGTAAGQQMLEQVQQLQQQIAQQQEQSQAYAPVYYPGTAALTEATKITLDVGEERPGVDFQLQLVPTARIRGHVITPDGSPPVGAQLQLRVANASSELAAPINGFGNFGAPVAQDGSFTFQNVTPGQYTLQVRVPIRESDPATGQDAAGIPAAGRGRAGFAGPGGRGGAVAQVLWASTDLAVDGRDVADVSLAVQPGMTIGGRVAFEGSSPPADLTTVRITLQAADGQMMTVAPTAQADSSGNFSINGVAPGKYFVRANVGGPGRGAGAGFGSVQSPPPAPASATATSWRLKSAMAAGQDALDSSLEIRPNDRVSGMLVTFTDQAQELSGTLQDAMGQPTSDYTIILFPADNRQWVPQSRRIMATRPSTDGKFTFTGFPAGLYRLTAVTDAEPGEWYDPGFLTQVVPASLSLAFAEGEKKTQDIRLATRPGGQ
jgi:hypothetical protein